MQKEIETLNAFAEKDCNKCELRAACFLAEADWKKAKIDYPCFWATDGLVLDIISKYHKEGVQDMKRRKSEQPFDPWTFAFFLAGLIMGLLFFKAIGFY